jgi:polycystin 1L2
MRLEKLEWIDKQTAALFVEFTFYNPNINMFQSCLILFELLNSGTFVTSALFTSIDLYSLNQTILQIILNIVYMILVVLIMIKEINDLRQKHWKYFQDCYNYFELLIIGFSWAAFSMYLYRLKSNYEILSKLKENSKDLDKININLEYISSCDSLLNSFLGLSAGFATLRFIKIFRFNKRIIVFVVALGRSFRELIGFFTIFFPLWLSFVQVIYFLLNDKSYEYSTFSNAMQTCFEIILGKFDSKTILHLETFLGPLVFVSYNVIIVFLMINLLISILIDYYEKTKVDPSLDEEDPEIFAYLMSIFASIFWCHKEKVNGEPVYKEHWDTLPDKFDEFLVRIQRVIHLNLFESNFLGNFTLIACLNFSFHGYQKTKFNMVQEAKTPKN